MYSIALISVAASFLMIFGKTGLGWIAKVIASLIILALLILSMQFVLRLGLLIPLSSD